MFIIMPNDDLFGHKTLEEARVVAMKNYSEHKEVFIFQKVATGRQHKLTWDDQQIIVHSCHDDPCNHGSPWDSRTQHRLKQEWHDCFGDVRKIANRMGRTKGSITSQIARMLRVI